MIPVGATAQSQIEGRAISGLGVDARSLVTVRGRVLVYRHKWMTREGMDGRVIDTFRRTVATLARAIANKSGRAVEVYASHSAGGYMVDQYEPEAAL